LQLPEEFPPAEKTPVTDAASTNGGGRLRVEKEHSPMSACGYGLIK
jgi:hypothetical protein